MIINLYREGQELKAAFPPLFSGSVGAVRVRINNIWAEEEISALRFYTDGTEIYTSEIVDSVAVVPHEVIKVPGFTIAAAVYEADGETLTKFIPTGGVFIPVMRNGYGAPDDPVEGEHEETSVLGELLERAKELDSHRAAAEIDHPDGSVTRTKLSGEVKAELSGKADGETTAAEIEALKSGKVDKVSGKGLSANDYTDADKAKVNNLPENTQDEIDALETTKAAKVYVEELDNKLAGEITARKAEGTSLSAEIEALKSGKVDKVSGKGLSANDYTDAAKAKVDDLPSSPGAEIEARAYKLYVEDVESSLKSEVTQRKSADKEIESKLSEKADITYVDEVNTKTVPRVSAEGSQSLVLTNALGGEKLLGCRIWGNCGKNLFDSAQLLEASGWTYTDGVYSGTLRALYDVYTVDGSFDIPYTGGQLAISLEAKNASREVTTFYFWVFYTDGTKETICPVQSTEWTKLSGVTSATKTIEKIQCGYSNSDTIYLRNIQIESGDACTDYEEFKGLGEQYGENGYCIPLECGSGGIPEVSVIGIGANMLCRGEYIDLTTCKRYDAEGAESGDITLDAMPTIPDGGYAVIGTSMTNGIAPERIEAEYILQSGRYAPLDENGKIADKYLYGETVKQYGVRWSGTSSTVCERLGDAAGLVANAHKGTTDSVQNDFDNIYPWCDMRLCNIDEEGNILAYEGEPTFARDGTNGDVMVEIPKFYYRREKNGTAEEWWISKVKMPGYELHPVFMNDGEEVSRVFHSAYNASDYTDGGTVKLQSITGAQPRANTTRATFRTYARNKGDIWGIEDLSCISALQILYLIEYADTDSQAALGKGVVSLTSSDTPPVNGSCDELGGKSGWFAGEDNLTDGYADVNYRGIEGFHGKMWRFVDGINIKDRVTYYANSLGDYADGVYTDKYTAAGYTNATNTGYVTALGYDPSAPWAMLPTAVGGSSSTYIPDYYYQAAGERLLLLGGAWSYDSYAGVFCSYCGNGSTYYSGTCGAHLLVKKK